MRTPWIVAALASLAISGCMDDGPIEGSEDVLAFIDDAAMACEVPEGAVISVAEGDTVAPGAMLHLSALDSVVACDRTITRFAWSVAQPTGEWAPFIPSAAIPEPAFQTTEEGVYVFTLSIQDSEGDWSIVTTEVYAQRVL